MEFDFEDNFRSLDLHDLVFRYGGADELSGGVRWQPALEIQSASPCTLTRIEIEQSVNGAFLRDTQVAFSNCFFHHNTEAPVHLEDESGATFSSDNRLQDNGVQGIGIGGHLSGDSGHTDFTLSPIQIGSTLLPFVTNRYIYAGLTVKAGCRLTLEPGIVLKGSSGYAKLTVYGSLNIAGTAGEPVVITSIEDDQFGGDTLGDGPVENSARTDGIAVWPIHPKRSKSIMYFFGISPKTLMLYDTAPLYASHCGFFKNSSAVNQIAEDASSTLEDCNFYASVGASVDVRKGEAVFTGCRFSAPKATCLLNYANLRLQDCVF